MHVQFEFKFYLLNKLSNYQTYIYETMSEKVNLTTNQHRALKLTTSQAVTIQNNNDIENIIHPLEQGRETSLDSGTKLSTKVLRGQ